MSDAKHTPGPWTVTTRQRQVDVTIGPNRLSSDVVEFRLYGGEDADADAVTIANARLIAAAPAFAAVWELVPDDIKGRIFDTLYTPQWEWVEKAITEVRGKR